MAQSRLETAQTRLTDAKAENSDKVEALEAAVNKQAERVNEAKTAFEATSQVKPNASKPANDIDTLKQKVLAAQTRVDKALERLNMAKEQNLETVDALQTGLDKQKSKLADAQSSLEKASLEGVK